jgi:lipopolysaccharide export system protein LptA
VVLKKGKNVMQGAQLTVNLVTGQAVLVGGVRGQAPGSSRVNSVFTPNSQ